MALVGAPAAPDYGWLEIKENKLKKLIVLAAVGIAGYFLYGKYFTGDGTLSTEGYSLRTVAEKPIPKEVFFKLWANEALTACVSARDKHNLSPSECESKVREKLEQCTVDAMWSAPNEIDTPQLAKSLGRPFIECVTPYFYCNGVEVKNQDEARRHCR